MARIHNFNPGPAALPLPVLERAAREMIEHAGSGMSIMEHSHRGKVYEAVHNEAIALTKELLGVGNDYDVLFLQGGASLQFAMVPMSFIPDGGSADYILTGGWSEKAHKEAQRVGRGKARVAASTGKDGVYTRIPKQSELNLDPGAAYVHITSNNTLFGTQWHSFPDTGGVPLVADMSSDFMWRPFDVSKFGLIYAGAQKNIGPSGLAVVLVRKTLVEKARADVPNILSYKIHAKENSLYNTPNTFGIYMARNVLAYTKELGGLAEIERRNRAKAGALYAAIDADPDFFRAPVEKESRSTMNVVFRLPSEELEKKFLADATARGLVGLKGHRSTGGIRVSLYNAVTLESTQAVIAFMHEFRTQA